jgi:hypothetical protein
MTPRAWAKPAVLKKKREHFERGRMTNHWPHMPKLFPEVPRTYGGPKEAVPPQEEIVLTELGRRLAGYD